MHLIVCVDERDGMSFCGRRLSRDKAVYAHILNITSGHRLWTSPQSAALFPDGTVYSDPEFLQKAGAGDYCFAETAVNNVQNPESVILYKWNRRYPSTERLPTALLAGMRLSSTEEFSGNSHDKITMERYVL